jgi:hypothetical protein
LDIKSILGLRRYFMNLFLRLTWLSIFVPFAISGQILYAKTPNSASTPLVLNAANSNLPASDMNGPIIQADNSQLLLESSLIIPINGHIRLSAIHKKPSQNSQKSANANLADKKLKAEISSGSNVFGNELDNLLDAALEQDSQTIYLKQKVAHYRSASQRAIAQGKDATDYLIPFRGFGPSSEAGDIILNEQVKIKSRSSAEYARQKDIDEKRLKINQSLAQIAMGLGMSDTTKGKAVTQQGMDSLVELVGQEKAQASFQSIKSMSEQISVPDSLWKQDVWDVKTQQDKHKVFLTASLESDPIIAQIERSVHKYNKRSKAMRTVAHIVQPTLACASLTPSFVGPAAKVALMTFVMSTGGPEQCKLLKELYLDKRLESRVNLINEETHLALHNYQIALLTRNKVLLAYSESVLEYLSSDYTVRQEFKERVALAMPELKTFN